jgi:hypothetical protein
MPKYQDVGRSWRTPAKNLARRKLLGRITGVAPKVGARRLVYYDLSAGNAKPTEDTNFWEGTSPGILIGYAAGAHKTMRAASVVILYEKNPKTFAELIPNLTLHLGPPTAASPDKARFDYVPRSVTTRQRSWCAGCGLYWAVENRHRDDCLATPQQRIQLVAKHRGAHIFAFCGDGNAADLSVISPGDCTYFDNDTNSLLNWAMRPTLIPEVFDRETWMCTTFSTLGANASGGPKRTSLDDERRGWYDRIEAIRSALPDRIDLGLFAIENDPHQWAYLASSPIVNGWREKTEAEMRSAFKTVGATLQSAWCQGDDVAFKALEDQLFLTKKERKQREDGLFSI